MMEPHNMEGEEKMNMPVAQSYSSPPPPYQPVATNLGPSSQHMYPSSSAMPTGQTTYVPCATNLVVAPVVLGPHSQAITCPHCQANISTKVELKSTTKTHLMALLICFLGCGCGCCLIPYCTDSCMGAQHSCPSCNNFLGEYDSGCL